MPRSTFGGLDTLPPGSVELFENLSRGVSVDDSLVYFLDVGTSRIGRIIVSESGNFDSTLWGGGAGRRAVGRFLGACCLVFEHAKQHLLLGEPSGTVTRYSASLEPLSRRNVLPPSAERGRLAGIWTEGMDTLFAVVSYDKTEAIVRIADGRIDTIVGDLGGAVNSENTGGSHGTKASGPSLLVPASVARMPDGGAAVGSSQQPVVLRLGRTGTMLWRRELLVPDLPGPLPRDAPADVRLAAYRVSSLVAIGANRLLATLFRPGRPQTVVKILTMGGEEGGTAVLPIPTWYYGVVRGRFLIAGQISDRHELASYELQF